MKESSLVDYSIIIPIYFNALNIKPTFNAIYNEVISVQKLKGEIIFVDDGSKDNSFNEILELKKNYPELIKLIKFTRNFGQAAAITAGFNYSKAKFAVNFDADLQDPPSLLNEIINEHFNGGFEISVGQRIERKESLYRRTVSYFWYRIIKKLTFENMPKNGFNVIGMGLKARELVLKNINGATPFSQLLILWTGFPIKFVPYKRAKREIGKSRFTFVKKIQAVYDSIISFSNLPIRFISLVGFIISLLGFIYAGMIIYSKLTGIEMPYKGWAPIMVIILVLSGFQMIMLGLIGEYLWRAIEAIRKRDIYIVEQIFE